MPSKDEPSNTGKGGDQFTDSMNGLFANFFGSVAQSEQRGADRRMALPISLEEAALGASKTVKATYSVCCTRCQGDGGEPGSKTHPCPVCEGKGTRGADGTSCPRCRGFKTIALFPCAECQGKKLVPRERELHVKVPAGIEDEQILRLADQGDESPQGGKPGHLLLEIVVAPHPRLRRQGADLLADVLIDEHLAAEGGSTTVPVLGGERKIKVPKGTETGATLRLRGFGATRLGKQPIAPPVTPDAAAGPVDPYRTVDPSEHRGDLLIRFVVVESEETDAHARGLRSRRKSWVPALLLAILGAVVAALIGNR